jgi:molecular chaperone GrpE (heat shock protein)
MDAIVQPQMPRSYKRRSPDQRVADLERRIAELKAKRAARDKKDDPVLREIQKLQQRLKRFIQLALNQKRPDIANSALGFKSSLDRILSQELGAVVESAHATDGEETA